MLSRVNRSITTISRRAVEASKRHAYFLNGRQHNSSTATSAVDHGSWEDDGMLAPRNPECLCKPTTVMNGAMLTQPAKLVGLFFLGASSSQVQVVDVCQRQPLPSLAEHSEGKQRRARISHKNAKKHQSKPYAFPLDSASSWHALLWFAWPFSMHARHGLVWGKTERKPIQCPFWTCCPPELRHDGEMDPMVGWVLWRKVCPLFVVPSLGTRMSQPSEGCQSRPKWANQSAGGPSLAALLPQAPLP